MFVWVQLYACQKWLDCAHVTVTTTTVFMVVLFGRVSTVVSSLTSFMNGMALALEEWWHACWTPDWWLWFSLLETAMMCQCLCQLWKTIDVAVDRYVTMLDVMLYKSVIFCVIMCIEMFCADGNEGLCHSWKTVVVAGTRYVIYTVEVYFCFILCCI